MIIELETNSKSGKLILSTRLFLQKRSINTFLKNQNILNERALEGAGESDNTVYDFLLVLAVFIARVKPQSKSHIEKDKYLRFI